MKSLMQNKKLSILVADEKPVIRWGLRHFLESQPSISSIREVATIAEMLETTKRYKPDIVITDLQFSNEDALRAIEILTGLYDIKVIAFTANENFKQIHRFLNAGGLGFLPKNCNLDELTRAMRAVIRSEQWISPRLKYSNGRRKNVSILTERECEVAVLVARGYTSRQIADKLCVSLKTVETHRYRIFKRLNIQNRAELVTYVMENGLIQNISN